MALKAVEKYIFETSQVIQSIKNHSKEIIQISKLIYKAQKTNKSIFVCGNGGSNSEAEHFVTELLCTYNNRKRKPISAISLNSSASSISAWSNDFQYNTFFVSNYILSSQFRFIQSSLFLLSILFFFVF